jgi:hypothetical protein
MNGHTSQKVTIWRQPAQVWAVAFACVIAFMGIGLVDPILPAIAESLRATPVETGCSSRATSSSRVWRCS